MTEDQENKKEEITEEPDTQTPPEDKITKVEDTPEEKAPTPEDESTDETVEIVEDEQPTDDKIEIVEDEPTDDKIEIVEDESTDDKEDIDIVDEEEEEEGYKPRMKPSLTDDEVKSLNLRRKKKKNQPNFRRQEWFRYKKLGDSWRKPRGIQSKSRRHFSYRTNVPSIGYRGPRMTRNRHPSGFEDILVHNPKDLEDIDSKKQAARIAHTVGTRKRVEIEKKAKELKIRILNRGL